MNIKLLAIVGIFFLSVFNVNAQKKLLSFGLWADCQYADIKDTKDRSYRNAKDKLDRAIAEFNRLRFPFAVSLGDIVDRNYYNFTQVDSVLKKADSVLYHVAGNHDFMVDSVQCYDLLRSLNIAEKPYYSVRRKGVRLVFLDSNEHTLYATCFDKEKRAATVRYRDSLEQAGIRIYNYNGSVSDLQLKWLDNELSDAQKAKELVIVFSHHPMLHIFEQVVAQNAAQVRKVMERYSCVKAHISGHLHFGGYARHNAIHYLIHEGMVQKKVENYFSKITIFDDRIEVEGNAGAKRSMKF